MSITSVYLKHFRNLKEQRFNLNPRINFIVGDNGSGKSSILESIFFVGHGKSFRTSKSELICHFEQEAFFLNVSNLQGSNFGVSKNKSDLNFVMKKDGDRIHKLSDLASNFAIQIVTPESFKLFFGGAKERRRFLELGLFHVEHEFKYVWKKFFKLHKQRNAVLKSRADKQTYEYWTTEFVEASIELSNVRQAYSNKLAGELSDWLSLLLPEVTDRFSLNFYQGWSQSRELIDVLYSQQDKEYKQGYCVAGAHKFDLKFLIDGQPLELKLSRGQQKLFLLALTLAQTKLIEKVKQVKPILLIDDFGAELDVSSRSKFNKALALLNGQIVISAIDFEAVKPVKDNIIKEENYTMFHVEHGEILEIEK